MNMVYERLVENDSDLHDHSDKFQKLERNRPIFGNPILLTLLDIVLLTTFAHQMLIVLWRVYYKRQLECNSSMNCT